jgi:L-lactate dehydrogenase
MARAFVEADLLGFSTHGLRRVPSNLEWLASGHMRRDGDPAVVSDRQAVFVWDAGLLPGPWVLQQALAEAVARVPQAGVVTAVLSRCTHVACLAAYLLPLLEQELVGLLMTSTPDEAYVSPFGAREAVLSNNPIAFAAPSRQGPLLFDVSTAVTAGGQIRLAEAQGRRLPEAALKTAGGGVSDDPAVLHADPPGSVMPMGGPGHGHKGYALMLMTEVLTQALAGRGRAAAADEGEANSVYLQVLDPQAFGGRRAFLDAVDDLMRRCRGAAPDEPGRPVRVPGERAWQHRQEALERGLTLHRGILEALAPWARRLDVIMPR